MIVKHVLGVLGGKDLDPDHLRAWVRTADLVLAADCGADAIVKHGCSPDWIVGDLDSLSPEALACGAQVVHRPEQDRTDADKLLAHASDLGVRAMVIAGVEGDRLDHVLGTLGSCARSALDLRLALRQGIGHLVRAGETRVVAVEPRSGVALVPLTPCVGAVLAGVEWPLAGQDLALDGLMSVSNRVTEPQVLASVLSGVALLIVEVTQPAW